MIYYRRLKIPQKCSIRDTNGELKVLEFEVLLGYSTPHHKGSIIIGRFDLELESKIVCFRD